MQKSILIFPRRWRGSDCMGSWRRKST